MGRLSERATRVARKTVERLGARATGAETFARAGVRALPELVGADLTTLSVCALRSGKRRVTGSPERALSAADIACFDRFFFAHPLVRFHTENPGGGTHRISDSLPDRAFRRTALYAEYYRRIGVAYAVAVPLYVDRETLVSFVLNRTGRDFDARERELLEAVRGPLAQIYRQARALDHARATVARYRAWFEAEGWSEVEVDAQCRIRRADRRALALLDIAVPGAGLRPGATLPAALVAWLTRSAGRSPAGAARSLTAGARVVVLRAMPAFDGGGWLLHVGERPGTPDSPGMAGAPLSAREREVLDWVAAGKTDAQAAAILGISARTVQKHLEHVYVKLGVEGRTAAVMRARAGR